MCSGTIMDKLVSFALPLMLSGILQLMFNAVDIIVVGRFSGSGATGGSGLHHRADQRVHQSVHRHFSGSQCAGCPVLCGGARPGESVGDGTYPSPWRWSSGIVMAVVGVVFARGALELMGTPGGRHRQICPVYAHLFLRHAVFHAVQLWRSHPAGSGRYEAAAVFPRHLRCGQCGIECISGGRLSAGCGGGSALPPSFSQGHFLRAGAFLPVPDGQQLSAAGFQTAYPVVLSGNGSLRVGVPAGIKHRHQPVQCAAPVVGKLLRLHCHGGLCGSQQHFRLPCTFP